MILESSGELAFLGLIFNHGFRKASRRVDRLREARSGITFALVEESGALEPCFQRHGRIRCTRAAIGATHVSPGRRSSSAPASVAGEASR